MRYISFLIKPASSACNLRCKYCFYEDESINRKEKSYGVMAKSTVDALLKKAYAEIEAPGYICFAFQGGEPTLAGLDYFRYFVKKAKENKPAGVELAFSVQTNGTLLDEQWALFLKENNFLVGISIDGNKALHNKHRVDSSGKGSYEKALQGYRLLEKHGVDTNALCVVTSSLACQGKNAYKALKELGFSYLQFIAVLDPLGEKKGLASYSLPPDMYGRFLCEVFDLYYEDWKKGDYHSIRLFDDYIHLLLGDNCSTCATVGRCGGYFVVEGDGSIYPCDFYVLDDYKEGNILENSLNEIAKGEVFAKFLARGKNKPEECYECKYRKLCNGGCPNDYQGGHNYYCSSFKALFHYAIARMMEMANAEIEARARR